MTRNPLRRTLTFLPLVSAALFFTLSPSAKLAGQENEHAHHASIGGLLRCLC